jgi:hypothetical protein
MVPGVDEVLGIVALADEPRRTFWVTLRINREKRDIVD